MIKPKVYFPKFGSPVLLKHARDFRDRHSDAPVVTFTLGSMVVTVEPGASGEAVLTGYGAGQTAAHAARYGTNEGLKLLEAKGIGTGVSAIRLAGPELQISDFAARLAHGL